MTMNTINARRELKRKLAAREHVFGGWVSFGEAAIAETFAKSEGFCSYYMKHNHHHRSGNRIITGVQVEDHLLALAGIAQ